MYILSKKNLILVYLCVWSISMSSLEAKETFYIKASLGTGISSEYEKLKTSSTALVMKNHSIAWYISDNLALKVGEFGGLLKQKTGKYNYINLDAFGVGFSYTTTQKIKISFLGAYSKVSLAKKWSEALGDDAGEGYGLNMNIDKEWSIGKQWAVQLGPQFFVMKVNHKDYLFSNVSLQGSLIYYFSF